jgi:hypothetical protein
MEFVRATQTILSVLLLDCLLCWIFASDQLLFGFLDPIFFMVGILAIGLVGFNSIESH